jgi:signal transduction histidine kinase
VIGSRFTGMHVVSPPNMYATVAPILAAEAVHAYETGGAQGFSRFSQTKVDNAERQLYLLNGFDRDVLSRPISDDGIRVAHAAKVGQLLVLRSNIAAYKVISPTGHPYILMLYMKSAIGQVGEVFYENGLLFNLAFILLVTGFCFSLAYHIASPIHSIQSVARKVAQGDLKARVPARVSKRYDELASLARDFDSMVDRLEALIGAQRNLLSSVSHELRSPLTRINLSVSLLRKYPSRDNEDTFQRLERDVSRIDVLMGQLLTLSRLEAGLPFGESVDVDVVQIVEEVVADGDFEAQVSGKSVTLHVEGPVVVRNADSFALRSACENIIRNAVRFTPPATEVQVVLRVQDCPSGPRAFLSVRDYGPGVPEESLQSIFRPFVRIDEGDGGNGLGLAIASEAIRMHHGMISASNLPPPAGLEVTIQLPLAASAAVHEWPLAEHGRAV